MLIRWTRKVLVLALAAFGMQYLAMVIRMVAAEISPEPVRRPSVPPRPSRAQALLARPGPAPAPRPLRTSTFEPQGAL